MPQGPVDSGSALSADVTATTRPPAGSTSTPSSTSASTSAPPSTDDRALGLRRQGKGYRTIAAELELGRPIDAITAFNRALRRRPIPEQAEIRAEEQSRLDSLADAVRRDDQLSQEDLDHRLGAIDRVRATLMSE